MDMKPPRVATIVGDAEADHAIATLVLAFGTDPVARWMYDDPRQYLLHIPRLFRALGTSSFEAGAAQRTDDGLGVALWLPPGVHGDDEPLEAVIAESMVGEKQAEVAAVFERTEHYRPTEPHWYLSLIGSKLCIETTGVVCGIAAAPPSPMRPRAPPSIPLVIEPAEYLSLREAWLCDRDYDSSGLVAFHLSHAAPCALKELPCADASSTSEKDSRIQKRSYHNERQ